MAVGSPTLQLLSVASETDDHLIPQLMLHTLENIQPDGTCVLQSRKQRYLQKTRDPSDWAPSDSVTYYFSEVPIDIFKGQ